MVFWRRMDAGTHETAARLVANWFTQFAWEIYSERSHQVNVDFILFTNSSSRNQHQKDRGGKTPMESKPGLSESITGDFGDSLSLHFPPWDVTSTIPIELGAPNSAA